MDGRQIIKAPGHIPPEMKVADHDTPTALHCNDPCADRIRQRASPHYRGRKQRIPRRGRKPSGQLRYVRPGRMPRLGTAGFAASSPDAGAPAANQKERKITMTRLLLCTATILATTLLLFASTIPSSAACLGFAACDNMPTGGPYRAINHNPATGRTYAREADYLPPKQARPQRIKQPRR